MVGCRIEYQRLDLGFSTRSLTFTADCCQTAPMSSASAATREAWHTIARGLIGAPEFTASEVAQHAGVELEQARRLWRALGFPPTADDDRIFTQADVTILHSAQRLIDEGVTRPEVLLQLTRATGQSLARLADVQIVATGDRLDTAAWLADPGAIADAITTALSAQVPRFEQFLMYVWRRHLLASLLRLLSESTAMTSSVHDVVVGFADLVGFTALSQNLDPAAIADVVDHFESLVYAEVPEHGGRVVKMIGDAVMFSIDRVTDAAEIALSLIERNATDSTLPEIRLGLALGPTVSFGGDLFGPTVNLASRLVDLARPGTVLVSDEIGTQLQAQPGLLLRRKHRTHLKGIGRVRTWALRRQKTG